MFIIFNSEKWYWSSSSRRFQPEPYFFSNFTEVEMEIKMAKRNDFTADILAFDDDISNDQAIDYIKNLSIDSDTMNALKDMTVSMGLDHVCS